MKSMGRMVFLSVFFLLITACGPSLIKMSPEVISGIKNEQPKITMIHYVEPKLNVFTAALVARSAAAGITYNVSAQERKIVKNVAVAMAPEDRPADWAEGSVTLQPSHDIQRAFSRYLFEKEGLKNLYYVDVPENNDELSELSNRYEDGIVIDFKTMGWLLSYCPLSWSKYRLTYVVRSRMIRSGDGKVLWQAKASYVGDCDGALTMEEVNRNDCEGLKRLLKEAEEACLNDLIKQFSEKN